MQVPFYKPEITTEDLFEVSKQLSSGKLTTGERVKEFEEEFAKFIGAPYCVAVNSLTNGYLMVLDMLNPIAANIPSATFVSMANMLKKMGVTIQFRDEWITGREYVIRTDKGDIIDSAHVIERDIFKKNPDAFWLFSFHSTKILTTLTGGMIATASEDQANFLRTIRDNGRLIGSFSPDYVVHNIGWEFEMSDVQAALGLSQLSRLDETIRKRANIRNEYKNELHVDEKDRFSQYCIQVWVDNQRDFVTYMKNNGVQVSKHFNPIHLQPAYYNNLNLPVTQSFANHLVSIPYFNEISDGEISNVSELIYQWRKK